MSQSSARLLARSPLSEPVLDSPPLLRHGAAFAVRCQVGDLAVPEPVRPEVLLKGTEQRAVWIDARRALRVMKVRELA